MSETTSGAAHSPDLRRPALVTGGRLVLDTRDPDARGWQRWNPADSLHQVTLPDGSSVDTWVEVTAAVDGAVSSAIHYLFPSGEALLSTATLRFRTEPELRLSLGAAGFDIEHIYGGWNREPVGSADGEFVVVARAT